MRFLIIDTQKEMQSGCQAAIELLQRNGILSEEETLSKFKEVWNAGYSKFEDYAFSSGDNQPDWESFSKTL